MSSATLRFNESATVVDRFVYFFVKHEDLRTKSWFLSNAPGPLFMILGAYLYFCLYAGPKYMCDRKPFELKNALLVYNAVQVVLSWFLFYEGYKSGWGGHYNFRCQPVTHTTDSISMRMARAVWLYYIAKITELLDTVFFVLRKKDRQISFLHLYHHTLMPICAFVGVKYFAGNPTFPKKYKFWPEISRSIWWYLASIHARQEELG